MTPAQATLFMARMADSWPDSRWPKGTVEEWIRDLSACRREGNLTVEVYAASVAEQARTRLRNEREHAPSWSQFLAVYRSLVRPAEQRRDDTEEYITLDEHIAGLERRAATGNAEAAEEWAIWRKHRHGPFGRALTPEGRS